MRKVKDLLSKASFTMTNDKFLETFGANAAVFFTLLVESENLFAEKDGWFYLTMERVIKKARISRRAQEQIIKEFEKRGFIEKKVSGFPSKRYFRLNYDIIKTFILNEGEINLTNLIETNNKNQVVNQNVQNNKVIEFVNNSNLNKVSNNSEFKKNDTSNKLNNFVQNDKPYNNVQSDNKVVQNSNLINDYSELLETHEKSSLKKPKLKGSQFAISYNNINNIYNKNINNINNINNIKKEKENIKEKEKKNIKSNDFSSLSENTLPLENFENEKSSKEASKQKKSSDNENKQIIEEIISYLNEKTGKHFKPNNQQTVKFINGRLSEGYTLNDFKLVIDNRCDKWLNDEMMKEFLRPSTLFRPSNFENYYNDAIDVKNRKQTEEEQSFIDSYSGILVPPNLPPQVALELYKNKNGGKVDYIKLKEWYDGEIKKWQDMFRRKNNNVFRQ